ncbi:5-formyltetrahydrofolate cyclo-ligase [Wielerella bovis]|uniref:5-formyltetrahydrofolate cyclo-ligase n=1 Tax=Wielerella bovis TaxID=2917790 RepID=UPI002019AB77|nr:5-formyltetrahydrofolate cyclo-ligase [Wielerella bovis]ULJ61339.1 5-formyltetrahydrofolate cyclo-ligase [Wielerella bovis]
MFAPLENVSNKKDVRHYLRQLRKRQPENKRQVAEKCANHYLKPWIKRGKRIAIYWAMGSEMRLNSFIQAAQKRGAHLYLPYIEPHSLRLWFTPLPIKIKSSLKPERKRGQNKFNIPQFAGKKIRADCLHTLVLPMVGIDQRGYRLGQGGGYYDCTLAACVGKRVPQKIAFGFACQAVAELPCEPHDMRVDYFVCEKGAIKIGSLKR